MQEYIMGKTNLEEPKRFNGESAASLNGNAISHVYPTPHITFLLLSLLPNNSR